MAGIDKIYVTYKQYTTFHKWINEYRLPRGFRKYLYSYELEDLERLKLLKRKFPVSNFPERIDMWLLANCRLHFIRRRIKQQYGLWDY